LKSVNSPAAYTQLSMVTHGILIAEYPARTRSLDSPAFQYGRESSRPSKTRKPKARIGLGSPDLPMRRTAASTAVVPLEYLATQLAHEAFHLQADQG
jgi:hypothetical protein